MGKVIRRRPSPAMVVALVALFFALAGGAYAGFTLPRNSVTSDNIRNGQVKTGDLAKNAVTSAKLKDGGVARRDLAPGAIGSTQIEDRSIAAADIGLDSIGAPEIGNGAIESEEILDGEIFDVDIADGAVASSEIRNGAVTSAKIGDGSVTSSKLADGSVTSSKLAGKVPEATSADSLGGITLHRLSVRSSAGQTTQVLQVGGLTLSSQCSFVGNNQNVVTATTSTNDASIHTMATNLQGAGGPDLGNNGAAAGEVDVAEDDDFDTGQTFTVLATGENDGALVQLVYATPGGGVVTAQFRTEQDALGANAGTDYDCTLMGTATYTPGPSS